MTEPTITRIPLPGKHPRHFQRLLLDLAEARRQHQDLCLVCRHNPGSQDRPACGEWFCLPEGFMWEEDPQKAALVRELARLEGLCQGAIALAKQPVELIDWLSSREVQELPNLMRRVADLEKALGLFRQAPRTRLSPKKPEI